ncbi:hypothetical protein [Mamestra configurata nucleopolyhedrovirus B]|uniref:Maco-B 141 n=1 Tax=Mamestra configurata nucleopolyhedrovirus B TaxID=204440 RepID=Q8JM13_9ABAC|nr:hypothetical protein McnBVgp140 [Mamestra configurata nucleopolyhedrovirus B]AAM95127.1 hypothetical protein [Mamestra configurata nucleopolyhedrovirus B]QNH90783.1 maco-B 141 [Mamestra configurata nucleopolyhedrovirus B]
MGSSYTVLAYPQCSITTGDTVTTNFEMLLMNRRKEILETSHLIFQMETHPDVNMLTVPSIITVGPDQIQLVRQLKPLKLVGWNEWKFEDMNEAREFLIQATTTLLVRMNRQLEEALPQNKYKVVKAFIVKNSRKYKEYKNYGIIHLENKLKFIK